MSNAPADYATRRWNPTTGCRPDLACHARCWARRFAFRHAGRFGYPKNDPFRPTVHADRLAEPLHWRKPQVVAVSFMGDLFCDGIPDEAILAVFAMAMRAPQHTYLFLTKRPERMSDFLRQMGGPAPWNFWFGVSASDQKSLDDRMEPLLSAPVVHRWLSIEPQVGPVDPGSLLYQYQTEACDLGGNESGCPTAGLPWCDPNCKHGRFGGGIQWVVQGCESGPLRRPFDLVWARSMRDQCVAAKAPYYLKQMPGADQTVMGAFVGDRVEKRPLLDGREWRETPW